MFAIVRRSVASVSPVGSAGGLSKKARVPLRNASFKGRVLRISLGYHGALFGPCAFIVGLTGQDSHVVTVGEELVGHYRPNMTGRSHHDNQFGSPSASWKSNAASSSNGSIRMNSAGAATCAAGKWQISRAQLTHREGIFVTRWPDCEWGKASAGGPGRSIPQSSSRARIAAFSASSAAMRSCRGRTACAISLSVKRGVMCCGQFQSNAARRSRKIRSSFAL